MESSTKPVNILMLTSKQPLSMVNLLLWAAGFEPVICFNPHLTQDFLDPEQLAEYPFWPALYSDRMTFPHRVEMWQYTHEGTVPGIQGKADINLWLP